MDPILAFRHALRRSRIRVDILLILLEHGRLSLADLARLVGAQLRNVREAIEGDEHNRRYKIADGLATLGLVRIFEIGGTVAFELTELGADVAARLAADVAMRRGGGRPRIRT